jgi:integrase
MARRLGEGAATVREKGGRKTGREAGRRRGRTCAAFKAALNLATEHDERIANRRVWETGLASIPDAGQSRNVILSESTVRKLIEEARKHSSAFGMLVEVAAVTGARVSQLAGIEVQDLQADRAEPRLMVPTSRKGKGTKKVLRRPVPIPGKLAERLQTLAADRPPTAPLLAKPSGAPWKKSDHSRLFARAAKAAEQDPEEVTIYALRHSNIVRQILAGCRSALSRSTMTPVLQCLNGPTAATLATMPTPLREAHCLTRASPRSTTILSGMMSHSGFDHGFQ